jgi:hypothetical protein
MDVMFVGFLQTKCPQMIKSNHRANYWKRQKTGGSRPSWQKTARRNRNE